MTDQDDDDMINTISSLVDMLEPPSSVSAGSEGGNSTREGDNKNTKEVINKISSLITKLVDEDETKMENDSSPGTMENSTSDDFKTPHPRGDNTKPELVFDSKRVGDVSVELPAYPTPYELWQKAHQPREPIRPTPLEFVKSIPKSERKKRADQVTERLLQRQRQEHFGMMMKQHKKLANELRGLTFTPNLHRTKDQNRKFVQHYEPLYKRYQHEIEQSKLSKLKVEDELRTAELSNCTFRPKISKFSAKKAKRESNRLPVEERCIQFGIEKEEWAKQRRDIIKRLELEGATFRPQLSKKSKEICARISRPKAQDRKRKFKIRHNSKDAGHENDTFHPVINHRSERKQSDSGVYDRLYARAKSNNLKRSAFARRYLNKFVKGVSVPLWAKDHSIPDEFVGTESALGGVERSELREGHYNKRGIRAHVCSEGYTNVIQWKKEYSFLIPRLQGS